MAKKIRVWDGSAWQDVSVALPYNAVHSAQASMPSTAVDGQIWLDTDGTLSDTQYIPKTLTSTTGDIIYASSANTPARLGIGTSGQLLGISGGVPAWTTLSSGANWTLLNAGGTALSGSSTVTVSGISAKDKIMVILSGASTVTANYTSAWLRLNADSGSNYGTFGLTVFNGADSSAVNNTAATEIPLARTTQDASNTMSGYALFSGCNSSGLKIYNSTGMSNPGVGAYQRGYVLGGYYNSSSAISSISIVSEAGNFDAGTVYVYTSA
jgi:hypothetical protein